MVVVLLVHTLPAAAQDSCSGVQVNPGDDLDAIVNGDPRDRATTFCVNAQLDGTTETYNISETLRLKDGDRLIGQTGETVTRGPATYGVPEVMIRPSGSLDKIIAALGKNIEIQWVDIAGAVGKITTDEKPQDATGAGITAGIADGGADGGFLVRYAVVHGNDAAGILGAKGRILNSEFYDNTQNPAFLGYNGTGVKGFTEFEAAHNFVHDEQGNGLWCSYGCTDDAARLNGAWFHHNLIVNNARWGLRYEISPIVASGVHSSQPTFLAENNEVHGNGHGGASMADAQNGTFRANIFGPATIAGVSYAANYNNRAIFFGDSGLAARSDLWNGDATGNELNGEKIVGCEKPDEIVDCHDTTAPRVTITSPKHNATGVAPSVSLTATFSEKMDPASIRWLTFKLFKVNPDGSTTQITNVSVSPSTDGLQATLNPTNSLQSGVTYKAVVTTGARDEGGNQLDQNTTTAGLQQKAWSFTVSS
jgi:hypothetical protein